MSSDEILKTPDGRYIVVRGRLWRCADPSLNEDRRNGLTKALMDARRAKGRAMHAGDDEAREAARLAVDEANKRSANVVLFGGRTARRI